MAIDAPYDAGTDHVGFSRTRQTLPAPEEIGGTLSNDPGVRGSEVQRGLYPRDGLLFSCHAICVYSVGLLSPGSFMPLAFILCL